MDKIELKLDLLDAGELAQKYIELRKLRNAKKKEVTAIEGQMDEVSAKMLALCNELNAKTIQTPYGTISRKTTTRFGTNDWGSFYEMVNKYDAPYVFEKRIMNTAMEEFLQAHPEAEPPGLNKTVSYVISVRKPT